MRNLATLLRRFHQPILSVSSSHETIRIYSRRQQRTNPAFQLGLKQVGLTERYRCCCWEENWATPPMSLHSRTWTLRGASVHFTVKTVPLSSHVMMIYVARNNDSWYHPWFSIHIQADIGIWAIRFMDPLGWFDLTNSGVCSVLRQVLRFTAVLSEYRAFPRILLVKSDHAP